MKQRLLSALGRVLARPFAVRLIQAYANWYAKAHPINSIFDLDGTLYMGRQWVIAPGTVESAVLEALTGYESIRLHDIRRADHDRDLHNHPFEYRTFLLRGWYAEQFMTQDQLFRVSYGDAPSVLTRLVEGGSTAASRDHSGFHRIAAMSRDGALTLFFMTENEGEWGFMKNGCKYIDSVTYLNDKGYRNGGKR